jgi:dihydrodipicolinate synthase/N-acetylneuraminate lyase
MLLEGLHIPLTTPFHPDGRLYLQKLASNVVRYSKSPAAGLIVLGPSGEPTLLSDDETRDVLRTAAQSAAPEKVLIAGISRESVRSTLDLIAFAASLHYDAVLLQPPAFFADVPRSAGRHAEIQSYFQIVADRSPLPVILAETTIRIFLRDCIAQLSAHASIIGILCAYRHLFQHHLGIANRIELAAPLSRKVVVTPAFAAVTARMQRAAASSSLVSLTSAPNLAALAEPPASPALRTRTKSVGFQILTADTRSLLTSLDAGSIGIAPAFAACAPQACYEVFAAWKDSDRPLAEEKQSRLLAAARLAEASPAALKYAADLNGYFGGLPRLPHLPPTGADRAALELALHDLRN